MGFDTHSSNARQQTAATGYHRIIPCLDINAGRVVKGINFVNLTDAGDPVEIAQRYAEQGADEITLLDITATTQDRNSVLLPVISAVAKQINVPVAVGGGIRTLADMQAILDAGASRVSVNSAAVDQPQLITTAADKFGSASIIVAIDAHLVSAANEPARWQVLTHGGKKDTGIDAIEWARRITAAGAGQILLTSMDRDGTKAGFDLELTRAVADAITIPVIASGGVGNLQHLADGVLKGHADAVLAASIFHFGEYTIAQAKEFMAAQGIKVRQAGA